MYEKTYRIAANLTKSAREALIVRLTAGLELDGSSELAERLAGAMAADVDFS